MAIPKIKRIVDKETPEFHELFIFDGEYYCVCNEPFYTGYAESEEVRERIARLMFIEHLLVENVI